MRQARAQEKAPLLLRRRPLLRRVSFPRCAERFPDFLIEFLEFKRLNVERLKQIVLVKNFSVSRIPGEHDDFASGEVCLIMRAAWMPFKLRHDQIHDDQVSTFFPVGIHRFPAI